MRVGDARGERNALESGTVIADFREPMTGHNLTAAKVGK